MMKLVILLDIIVRKNERISRATRESGDYQAIYFGVAGCGCLDKLSCVNGINFE